MFHSVIRIAVAVGLVQASLAHVAVREELDTTSNVASLAGPAGPKLKWADVKALVPAVISGKKYGCKCYPGQSCWPSQSVWSKLNQTVGGGLVVHIPPAAACHNTFEGPLGTIKTYDAAGCASVQANWASEQWTYVSPVVLLSFSPLVMVTYKPQCRAAGRQHVDVRHQRHVPSDDQPVGAVYTGLLRRLRPQGHEARAY